MRDRLGRCGVPQQLGGKIGRNGKRVRDGHARLVVVWASCPYWLWHVDTGQVCQWRGLALQVLKYIGVEWHSAVNNTVVREQLQKTLLNKRGNLSLILQCYSWRHVRVIEQVGATALMR